MTTTLADNDSRTMRAPRAATGMRPRARGVTLHTDGGFFCEGATVGGKRDGRWIYWYGNGQRQSDLHFDRGLLDGAYLTWHENGARKTVGAYRQGLPHGRWCKWHENGALHSQSEYQHGVPTGTWKHWDDNGKLIARLEH